MHFKHFSDSVNFHIIIYLLCRARTQKMLVRKANREDLDQTASRDYPRPNLGPNIGPYPFEKMSKSSQNGV